MQYPFISLNIYICTLNYLLLKIAIFANGIISNKIGGAQKHMREVIKILPKFHEIYFFPEPQMFGNQDILDFQFIRELQTNDIIISSYFLEHYKTKPVIKEIIKSYSYETKNCDLIYDMDFQYYLDNIKYRGEISSRLSKINNMPLGVCLQDMGDITSYSFDTFKNIINFFKMAAKISWFIASVGIYNLLNRKITAWKLLSSKNLSFITIINNEYRRNINIDFKNTYILNPSNAIDNTIKKYQNEEKRNQIIFYARLIYQKGLFDVIYIHKKIVESINIKLIISGRFQREFEKKEFFNLIKKLGIEIFVEYAGVLNDDELYLELSRSKLMVYPSHSDSFSISVLQALYLQVPVVAYDIPGLSLYRNFECVSMAKEFDLDSMAEKALNFLKTGENIFNQPELVRFIESHSLWNYVAASHLSAIDNISKIKT
jgi:glycosyltransferase involved in cell wall biosynthesis